MAPAAGRTGLVVARRRPGVRGRPAHVRPPRTGADGSAGRCPRCACCDGGTVRRAVRLAGPYVRSRRAEGQTRVRLGEVRLPGLAATVLVGRERAGTRVAARGVLQRADHRDQVDGLMAYRFTASDVAFLRSTAGADALAALADRPLTDRLADVTAARAVAGDRFAAALETAVLRGKAAAKLAEPGRWLLCDAALQQATPTAVAAHRASRLRGRDVHDVTCGIGADLAELAAVANRCLGSDVDPVRLAM